MKLLLITCILPLGGSFFIGHKRRISSFTNNFRAESSITPSVNDAIAIEALAGNIVNTLFKSDLKRKSGIGDGGASGWTSWVDDDSAAALQSVINVLSLTPAPVITDVTNVDADVLLKRDEIMAWTRWMKAIPSSCIVDLSSEIRSVANTMIYDHDLEMIECSRNEFLQRICVNLILLPSGKSLQNNIRTPAGAMAYGKLIFGGVTRYRLLPGKMQRRTGENTALKSKENENVKAWIQYGGPLRNYEALDIGASAILEVIILPPGLNKEDNEDDENMKLSNIGWELNKMIAFYDENRSDTSKPGKSDEESEDRDKILYLSGKERNEFFMDNFTQTVGGLQPQIAAIVRRVLDGRVYRSQNHDEQIGYQSLSDAKELESLGLTAVRGLLLYGKPGCGKTLLAREIAKALHAREPKIVAAPELLDKWVGGSEKLVRNLFEDAEAELRACGGDATKSSLHVIVIDEIDAVFRKRSSSEDSFASTRASAVNQILAKLDGVNAINNVLMIGMTNRRDLLDEALLRPGRLEVQIEIPKPDKEGRREILKIHFEALRRRGRLSAPLCAALDGSDITPSKKVTLPYSLKQKFQQAVSILPSKHIKDLAAVTENFSGADCAGLVRCAGSHALARSRRLGQGIDGLQITLDDVGEALIEMRR